ncbi:putative nucleolar protein-like protein [Hapsidospora chrysogenum ATCC 11550]|uniref:Putative nucleolar protein-like protein n=1 Tax=Hapsidospora chrysogenum (strain ATCC 11550 / CBS 779.69 / DSM 880 / IAM 14645 / JCM 23072 / IMI 49137) TaxID=857340 RepID=A0A086TDG1_HAPC1|nr:putative nucleolar protein-like protein [Hapsidospora chrysogenum ATCC 11550]
MFEIPEAKRVRREDLNESGVSGDSDSEADAQIRAQLEAQVARSLGLDLEDGPKQQQAIASSSHGAAASRKTEGVEMKGGEGERSGPEEYDFYLFGGAGTAPTKVVLEDDSECQGEGAILKQRPTSFYLAKDLTEDQRRRFKASAVTGDEVLARSQSRWWSMELPWKVTHITATTKKKPGSGQKATTISTSLESTEAKRKRPGKKRRIALRMKLRAEKDKMKTAAQLKEEKEEHLKEKKKRLNRLKKLKRREKEKEKKQAAAKGGQGAADSGSGLDGST